MKIGKKLKLEIDQAIYNEVFQYLCYLDSLDREGKISHEAWKLAHEKACGLSGSIEASVLNRIEMYWFFGN